MKYERMKNNGVRENAGNADSERLRNIGIALDYAMSAQFTFIRDFEKEAARRMMSAGIPQDEMRKAIDKYSRKLRHAILNISDEVSREFNR